MMVNNVAFTGVQKTIQSFMTDEAHKFIPAGKIFNKAEVAAAAEAAKAAKAADEVAEVPFFNHRGNNIIDDELVAKLQGEAAAKSYAKSHGVHVPEEAAESTIKINA